MSVTLFTSPRFADHLTPPGHPERVERYVAPLLADAIRRIHGNESISDLFRDEGPEKK